MKLLFVRHAETDWNKANRFQGIVDRNLNENGKKQAKLLSDYLYEKIPGINKIYTSPLLRTKDTALAVGNRFNLKVNEMDSLKEYSVGIFSGKNIDDINYSEDKEIYDNFMIDNNWDLVPDAEKFQSRYQRAIKSLQTIFKESNSDDSILVVSHGGFMQTLISVFLGSKRTWGFKTNNTGIYEFDIAENNLDITDGGEWVYKNNDYLVLNPKKWSIIRFNDITHLKRLESEKR